MAKTGFNKELKCSEELQAVIHEKRVSRGTMMKLIWKFIKKHKLQDKKDKRTIVPNEKLAKVLGSKPVNMFKMVKKLSEHLS